ncbi:MAG: adenosylcobalamin-dependent ribonucleoside-diphosphate reductase [Chloroflexota bacterium]
MVQNTKATPRQELSGPPTPLREIDVTENSKLVLEKRYVRKNADGSHAETLHEMFWRVGSFIARAELEYGESVETAQEWAERFYNLLTDMRFLPNSPTFTGADTPLGNLSACYVLPIADDMGGHADGIFQTLRNATLIQQTGGGNGFSFSRLRPKGARVRSSNGFASGPIGFLKAYDEAFGIVNQGGVRRGANMGVLRVDHPDIRDFVSCKQSEYAVTNFNISVALTDKFMQAVKDDTDFELVNPDDGEVWETLRARDLFDMIIEYAHNNGEPGALFIDAANRGNPVPHLGEYEATNPCGEQWLLPYESCNLGSINLSKHVVDGVIDWDALKTTIEESTRFLDNVVTMNRYVDAVPQLRDAALRGRRIGLGIMGLADMMMKLDIRYGSEQGQEFAGQIMEYIRYHSMMVSTELAKKHGAFPAIKGSIYDRDNLKWRAPQPLFPYSRDWGRPNLDWGLVEKRIRQYGIRNTTQVTVAPTGTRATVAGCEGYGCEPVFALAYTRWVVDTEHPDHERIPLQYTSPNFEDGLRRAGYDDEAIKAISERVGNEGTCQTLTDLPEIIRHTFVVSSDITPEEHVRMQAALQPFVDSSISKTINMPSTATTEDVATAYMLSWELGCKGLTVYVTGSRSEVVLETKATKDAKSGDGEATTEEAAEPMETVFMFHEEKEPRPAELVGKTYRTVSPAGTAYITVNESTKYDHQPFEVFINTSKAGSEIAAISESMGRLISLILRIKSPISPRDRMKTIVDQLNGIGAGRQMGFGPNRVASFPDAISQTLDRYLAQIEAQIEAENNTDGHHANGNGNGNGHGAENALQMPLAFEAKEQPSVPTLTIIGDICPECGAATLIKEEGCVSCHSCGYAEC